MVFWRRMDPVLRTPAFRPVVGAFPHLCPGEGCAVCAHVAGWCADPDPSPFLLVARRADPIFRSTVPPATGVLTLDVVRRGMALDLARPADDRGNPDAGPHRQMFVDRDSFRSVLELRGNVRGGKSLELAARRSAVIRCDE